MLPNEQRSMVATLVVAGHNPSEIARVFNCTERTIRNITRDAVDAAKEQRSLHQRLMEILDN